METSIFQSLWKEYMECKAANRNALGKFDECSNRSQSNPWSKKSQQDTASYITFWIWMYSLQRLHEQPIPHQTGGRVFKLVLAEFSSKEKISS